MKPWIAIVTATTETCFAFGFLDIAGARHPVDPPGKGIHTPAKETSQRAPIPNVRPAKKIGPRHTIVPQRYWVGR